MQCPRLTPFHRLSSTSSLLGAKDIRQQRVLGGSTNTAKSFENTQAPNSNIGLNSETQSKRVNHFRSSSRRNPSVRGSSGSSLPNFRPFGRDESGFQYSAPGQRVQISFGSNSLRNRFQTSNFASISDSEDVIRPTRGIGRALNGGVKENLIPSRGQTRNLGDKAEEPEEKVSTTTTEVAVVTTTTESTTTTAEVVKSVPLLTTTTVPTTTSSSLPRRRFRPIPIRRPLSKDGVRQRGNKRFSLRQRGGLRRRPVAFLAGEKRKELEKVETTEGNLGGEKEGLEKEREEKEESITKKEVDDDKGHSPRAPQK